MPYTIEHRILPKLLEVHIKGTIVPGQELKEATERWSRIANLCKVTGRDLVLAYIDLEGQHSTSSKFNLVDAGASFGWRPEYKLAVVVKHEEQYLNLSFTETVMNNLGYEMKLFMRKRDAEKWLLA